MARRSTPERIDTARRAATRNRLIGERMTEETADAWIAAWEASSRVYAQAEWRVSVSDQQERVGGYS
jgi:hypothetical protein